MSMLSAPYDNATEAAAACGHRILEVLNGGNAARGTSSVAFSGGSSPKIMFQWMAAQSFDWSHTHIFWVDERDVPPGDQMSNYRMAREALLIPAAIAESNIHRMEAERGAVQAAEAYKAAVVAHFRLEEGELPKFDVIHLGMGPDAHIASLFPGEPLLEDRQGIVSEVYVDKLKQSRITLLPGVLLAALNIFVLATGADKREALSAALNSTEPASQYPMQTIVKNRPDVEWFVDRDILT